MKSPPAYRPHQEFAAQAKTYPELWRIPMAIVVMICVVIVLQLGVYTLTAIGGGAERAAQALAELSGQGSGPRALLVVLFGLGFRAIGIVVAVRSLHDRGLVSLLGHLPTVLEHAGRVTIWVGALFMVLALILPHDPALQRNPDMPGGLWMLLLPLGLIAILVQVCSEELLFRGYLQQQLAVRFASPVVFMGLPALVFALGHGGSQTGDNALLIMCWAGAFGLAAGDLTARTGSLGAAIGLHFANNVFALLGLSLMGPSGALALFHLPLLPDDPAVQNLMLPEFASLLCAWLTARLALRI